MTEISKEQRLQELIERLPKTADGVPFGLGSTVYCSSAASDIVEDDEVAVPLSLKVDSVAVGAGGRLVCSGEDPRNGHDLEVYGDECYSTQEGCDVAIQASKSDLVVVTWDWKEQPPWGRIEEACHRWVKAVIWPAETHTDEHAVVIGPFGTTPEQVEVRMVQWRKAGK